MIPLFLPLRVPLSLLPSEASGSQGASKLGRSEGCSFSAMTAGQGSGTKRPMGSGA